MHAEKQKEALNGLFAKSRISSAHFVSCEFVWDLPLLTLSAALYSFPVPFLSGMNISSNNRALWCLSLFSTIFVHLLFWRQLIKAIAFVAPTAGCASFITVAFFTISHLTSGLVVHPQEKDSAVFHTSWLSPHRWIAQALLEPELLGHGIMELISETPLNSSELTIGCERKEVLARMIKDIPIYTVSQCSSTRGSQLLYFHGFLQPLTGDRFPSSQFFLGCMVMGVWMLIASTFLLCATACSRLLSHSSSLAL